MSLYFTLENSPIYPEKYLIRVNPENFPMPHGMTGSYNVLMARLMNLDWPTFLRFARDELGAELIGKKSRYILPYFDMTPDVKSFIKLLNARMKYVLNEQEFPYEYKRLENGDIERTPFKEGNNESDS